MRNLLATTLSRLAYWIHPKRSPSSLRSSQWTGTTYSDAFHRNRQPSPNELLAELKGTAWTCASINASVCANYAPRLYVTTHKNQPRARCQTRALDPQTDTRIRSLSHLSGRHTKAVQIEEVLDHPLLTLLEQVNPLHNSFDLWELTTLYQEVHGSAYWHIPRNGLGVPNEIWILPTQNVTPKRDPNSKNIIDSYVYRTGQAEQQFSPDQIIHFRYPDPRDPYTAGLGPLRACYEQVVLLADYAAIKKSIYENNAIPAAVVSTEEPIGEEERDRLETQWNDKFRRGGSGKVLVGESGLKVQVLAHSMGDLAALADMKATKEDIANAFHVPLSFLTAETNLANLQAAEHQHQSKAIAPRLQRRDEKINEQLVPMFDPSGRLFVASDDPIPANRDYRIRQQETDLKYGVITINEVRQERGLPPVAWGNTPWLPLTWAPSDYDRPEAMADSGRNVTNSLCSLPDRNPI